MKRSPGDDAASIGRFAGGGVTRRNGDKTRRPAVRQVAPSTVPGAEVARATSATNRERSNGSELPDLQRLADEISRLAPGDAVAATQRVRELMASLPEAYHGELAAGVAGRLDDATLHALSQGGDGRDLLVVLASRAHDQIGRLTDALYSVPRRAG